MFRYDFTKCELLWWEIDANLTRFRLKLDKEKYGWPFIVELQFKEIDDFENFRCEFLNFDFEDLMSTASEESNRSEDGPFHLIGFEEGPPNFRFLTHYPVKLSSKSSANSLLRFSCVDFVEIHHVVKTAKDSYLTSPHTCSQCYEELMDDGGNVKTCRIHSEVICKSCEQNTTVFANLHRCLNCSKILESPRHDEGEEYECKACGFSGVIPRYLLQLPIDRTDIKSELKANYLIRCPSCEQWWTANRNDAGKQTFCQACFSVFNIPAIGTYLDDSSTSPIQPTRNCHCCGQVYAKFATSCPLCGAIPEEQYPASI